MATILEIAAEYKQRLASLDSEAVVFLLNEYAEVVREIQQSLNELTARLTVLKAQGRTISENDLYLEVRYRRYITLLREEMNRYAELIAKTVSEAQEKAVRLAIDSTEKILRETYRNGPENFDIAFMRFDEFSARNIVAKLSDINYLRGITGTIEPQALVLTRQILINGVVQGLSPKQVAFELIKKLDFARLKAETIATTEIVSAYRDGNLERYRATDVVKLWQWSATLDDRTCPVCIALDGQEFSLETPFSTHPRCRCSPLPVTRSWDELGLGEYGLKPVETPFVSLRGEDWFKSIGSNRQKEILGPRKYELYSEGKISLADLVESYNHPVYGPSRQERSLKDLKALKNL